MNCVAPGTHQGQPTDALTAMWHLGLKSGLLCIISLILCLNPFENFSNHVFYIFLYYLSSLKLSEYIPRRLSFPLKCLVKEVIERKKQKLENLASEDRA